MCIRDSHRPVRQPDGDRPGRRDEVASARTLQASSLSLIHISSPRDRTRTRMPSYA